uniref:Uncharacterized protein n=1 Tax=Anguilla anguilla TaxID=7936 RepID=A0A0E9PLU4_ANGAN
MYKARELSAKIISPENASLLCMPSQRMETSGRPKTQEGSRSVRISGPLL